MFIVFEGIDGSGKTTLSGKVAEILTAQGLSVHQARPQGELKSRLAGDIRTLARDPRNLTMSPHTELFLFIARDTQTIDTVIRPQLQKAQVVIADRYLYSAQVLCRARGEVSAEEIDTAVDVAARGLWPDLVVYCDVDIDTSALRKSIDKIVNPRAPEDFGRKGLRGLGLRDAMRNVYLDLAAQNPDTWFTVDNAHASIQENTYKIANRILELAGKPPVELPSAAPSHEALPETPNRTPEDSQTAFYDYLRRLTAAGRPAEAAYHLRSLNSEEAWDLRAQLVDTVPDAIVYGLLPLSCERALEMRRRLIDKVPGRVARSLGAVWGDADEEAWEMRRSLARKVPIDVACSFGSLDTEPAWELREMLVSEAGILVLSTLKGMDFERAWAFREKWGKKKNIPGLLKGLARLDTERAWALRNKHKKNALPWFILSLSGLETDESWKLRSTYLENATKLVIRSIPSFSDLDTAWDLRRKAAPWAKEAITTIKGIDSHNAWALRRDFMDRWPGAAAKSVGMTLALTDKGLGFLTELAEKNPGNPDVLHYLVKAIESR